MLLVEEFLGIELPDPEGLLPPPPSETVELSDNLDDDEDTDEHELLLVAQKTPARRLQVAMPARPPASVRAYNPPPMRVPDPLNTPEPRSLRRYAFNEPDDAPESFISAPEPLRLALPTNAEGEASLILAGAAPEDYDDDWDSEDDLWDDDSEEDFETGPARIRLTLDNDTMEDLRNLEERRSFTEPIWGPRPAADRYDSDISLFDESDEDDSAIFEQEEIARQARDDLSFSRDDSSDIVEAFSFDDDSSDDGSRSGAYPRVASVRIGLSDSSDVPEPLIDRSERPIEEVVRWEDESPDSDPGLTTPEADPLRSYSIVPDEEPTRLHDKPLIEPEKPRPRRRPPPPEEERGSPLIWLIAITILITVGGWAVYVLVKDLAWSPQDLYQLSTTDELPSETTTPDGTLSGEVAPVVEAVTPEGAAAIGIPQEGVSGASLDERLEPTEGRLRIVSDRKSRVYINGERKGTTPIESLVLDAGVYDVRLVALSTGRAKRVQARVD
ncbi:MAG: hypothetical protein ACI8S6_005266, partial [Myxococcota bacterium]